MTRFSKAGYVLSTAGSAIGLGGIWGFPYLVGQHEGVAYTLIFVLAFLYFVVSAYIVELLFGRTSGQNSVSTFEEFAPKNLKFLKYGGFMEIYGVRIFAFYVVVLGWLVHYYVLKHHRIAKNFRSDTKLVGGVYQWSNWVANAVAFCRRCALCLCP